MNDLIGFSQEFLKNSNADAVAVGVLNFKTHEFKGFEILNNEINESDPKIFFDYASLTKALGNSFVTIANKLEDKKLKLLLNHRAGLPAWGLLPKSSWKEQINSYSIKESDTLYSDFSALRFMLEVEKILGKDYKDLVLENLNPGIRSWLDLTGSEVTLQNGYFNGRENYGKVHDPNAYNLECFTSHAGLFGTVKSLGTSILEFDKKHNLLKTVSSEMLKDNHRFCLGFDTVTNPENTLAGNGCSKSTFGHLGFTGTSFWIDAQREIGHIILSNSTKYFWFDKLALNQFRRKLGEHIWLNYS
jgi:CubicO group peptidase (beta-lactamase class C family)